jgi:hypothetical protein
MDGAAPFLIPYIGGLVLLALYLKVKTTMLGRQWKIGGKS